MANDGELKSYDFVSSEPNLLVELFECCKKQQKEIDWLKEQVDMLLNEKILKRGEELRTEELNALIREKGFID